jgi:hypothetical protein
LGGSNLNYFTVKQFSCPTPSYFSTRATWRPNLSVEQWLIPYVLELSYTSWRLREYAADLGDIGNPFRWAVERRLLLKADLDAAFFHIFGLRRSEAEHVLNSFPIVQSADEEIYGYYRTRNLILEAYDRMAAAIADGGKGWKSLADIPAGQGPRHPA